MPGRPEGGRAGRVRVRRSGGFTGVAAEQGVDLDALAGTDAAAAEELGRLVEAAGLQAEQPTSEPQPDRFVYDFEVDGVHRTIGEADLTEEQRQLAQAVLAQRG